MAAIQGPAPEPAKKTHGAPNAASNVAPVDGGDVGSGVGSASGKKAKMQPRSDSPPGLETDGEGNVIPLDQRTPEDQMKAAGNALPRPKN